MGAGGGGGGGGRHLHRLLPYHFPPSLDKGLANKGLLLRGFEGRKPETLNFDLCPAGCVGWCGGGGRGGGGGAGVRFQIPVGRQKRGWTWGRI